MSKYHVTISVSLQLTDNICGLCDFNKAKLYLIQFEPIMLILQILRNIFVVQKSQNLGIATLFP